ncbi:MAG: hypothetical protein K6E98_04795 [Lachnospiraceae bacterium]|nr:hypothetical protein [Lachnospiraceae bacterium]
MIDIYDALWAPRLIVQEALNTIKNLFKKKNLSVNVLPMIKHKEEHLYPRPKLRRISYKSLNGVWDFAPYLSYDDTYEPVLNNDPFKFKINVPFPVEALLSGVCGDKYTEFAYRKIFELKDLLSSDDHLLYENRLIIHFGAVDQSCRIYINNNYIGEHEGGYLPFYFDITDYIHKDSANEIIVKVKDDLNKKYPYGKQSDTPKGMWYTQVSGIWQSVWMEWVPKTHINSIICSLDTSDEIEITSKAYSDNKDIGHLSSNNNSIKIEVKGTGVRYKLTIYEPHMENERYPADLPYVLIKQDNRKALKILREVWVENGTCYIKLSSIKLWSQSHPYIYRIKLETEDGSDVIESYFTLRKISINRINEQLKICLNDEPVFFHGILDQGYFSDGLYTPVSDRYFEDDIRNIKELGFNVIRKHIKVEIPAFYYDCDRLGIMVFQDMVNNGDYSFIRDTLLPTFVGQWKKDSSLKIPEEVKNFYINHCIDTINHLKGYGCIIYYTVFNEGWGQFDSEKLVKIFREIDGSKIYDGASGWFKQKEGMIDSDHFYYHKIKPHKWSKPVIISECGGYVYRIKEHSYCPDRYYGYGDTASLEGFTKRISELYEEEVIPNIKNGICGTVYTQICDVEYEINGLYTYDREICKVDKKKMKEISEMINREFLCVIKENGIKV